jgi:hypothetical protein
VSASLEKFTHPFTFIQDEPRKRGSIVPNLIAIEIAPLDTIICHAGHRSRIQTPAERNSHRHIAAEPYSNPMTEEAKELFPAGVGTGLCPNRALGICSSGKHSRIQPYWSSQRRIFPLSISTYFPTVNYFMIGSGLLMKVFGGHTKRVKVRASETLSLDDIDSSMQNH